jgi:arsenite methyltransferase
MGRTTRAVALVIVVSLACVGCNRIKRWGYAGSDRDEWQQTERVIATLGVAPGARVADLGAGGGYFAFPLAEAVGPEGRVFAIDVDAGMVEYLRAESEKRGLAQLTAMQATEDDPRVPESGVDLLFTCNTYHHLHDRVAYFERLRGAILPGGVLAVIEYRPEGGFFHERHATGPEVIRRELEEAGWVLLVEHDFLERQSFLVFSPSP